eukprot:TRINITY_DN2442_c0_g1_i2.p1 TRINITY_DN2442_c0_g1~~TRINITY_DN2442_c0_g1_i2.p1  ORF type:complete len:349 (-),score=86.58 TRINITY_DN2442_c0_g1_i2:14-1060(-)
MKAKLSLYRHTPPNGLVLFCGYECKDNKKKMINVDLEPFEELRHGLYSCGSTFQTDLLREQLTTDNPYGFILIDGDSFGFYMINGNVKKKLYSWDKANLPKKHGRGGQSQNRFSRIRDEKRHAYVCKVSEAATHHFISSETHGPIVKNIIIAGFAQLKNDLVKILDQRLKDIVAALVDVQYGGSQGLNEAISKSSSILSDLEYQMEQNIIQDYFEEISKGTDMCSYGLKDTLYALEAGALEKLLIWSEIPHIRFHVLNKETGLEEVLYLESMEPDETEFEILDEVPLIEWIFDNYETYGTSLEVVSDNSPEGTQFVKGFSGIGGIMRFRLDLPSEMETDEDVSFDYEW